MRGKASTPDFEEKEEQEQVNCVVKKTSALCLPYKEATDVLYIVIIHTVISSLD